MARKHLSVRLDQAVLDRLDAESQRVGVSRSQLATTLLDEGLRMQRHPGIVFRPGPTGRRPALIDGPDLWEVVSVFRNLGDAGEQRVKRTAEIGNLESTQVRTALRYYAEFQAEVDSWIERVEKESASAEEEWLQEQDMLSR